MEAPIQTTCLVIMTTIVLGYYGTLTVNYLSVVFDDLRTTYRKAKKVTERMDNIIYSIDEFSKGPVYNAVMQSASAGIESAIAQMIMPGNGGGGGVTLPNFNNMANINNINNLNNMANMNNGVNTGEYDINFMINMGNKYSPVPFTDANKKIELDITSVPLFNKVNKDVTEEYMESEVESIGDSVYGGQMDGTLELNI